MPAEALRVIVTRPAAQALPWVAALQALGADAAALPLIGIAPPADPAPVRAAWSTLERSALVVFVSPNAVQQFFAARPAGAPWPPSTLAGATGPGTSAALRDAGVAEPLIVEPPPDAAAFDSEALWTLLAARDWAGRQVLVVRGEDGRDWLADTLAGRGAHVGFVAAYRREPPTLSPAQHALLRAALAEPWRHRWLFSSSEAIGHLQRLAAAAPAKVPVPVQPGGPQESAAARASGAGGVQRNTPAADATGAQGVESLALGSVWASSTAAASHPRIVQTARTAGFGHVALVAPAPEAVARWLLAQGV